MNQEQLARVNEIAHEHQLGVLELYRTPMTFRGRAIVVAVPCLFMAVLLVLLLFVGREAELLREMSLPYITVGISAIVLGGFFTYYVVTILPNRSSSSVYVYTGGLVCLGRDGRRIVRWENIRKVGIERERGYVQLNDYTIIRFPGLSSRGSASDKALQKFIEEKMALADSPLSPSSESSPSPSSVESNPYFPIPSEDVPPQPSVHATSATTSAEVRQEETKRKAGDIMLSIALYLLGVIVALFGFSSVLISTPDYIYNLTLFLGVPISIVILVFVLRKHKRPRYHAKQRLSILFSATVSGYLFLRVLGYFIGPLPPQVLGMIFTVYGVVVAIAALW